MVFLAVGIRRAEQRGSRRGKEPGGSELNSMKSCRMTMWGLMIWVVPASVVAQPAGHHAHPPMPDQPLCLFCRVEDGSGPKTVRAVLKLTAPDTAADLGQSVDLPPPLAPLHIVRYLPRAEREQRVVAGAGPDAKPAVELAVEGPTQSYQLWLMADNAERNRLVSLVGAWRYMSVADKAQRDELFEQWKVELVRPPVLLLSRADGTGQREFTAQAGRTHTAGDLRCTMRVRAFYPDFSYDRETNKPVNQSEQRLNPAALVELESQGRKEERWVFAKFPEFSEKREDSLPYRVILDCPVEQKQSTPDYVLVTQGGKTHEVWQRFKGENSSRVIVIDQRVEMAGSQYSFRMARFVPAGRLIESFIASKKKGAGPALLVERATGTTTLEELWLEMNRERTVHMPKGKLVIWFGPEQNRDMAEHKPDP
jgi:hypothetical protein